MGNLAVVPDRAAVQDTLGSARGPVYFKTCSPVAVAVVLEAHADMTDPPPLRVVLRPLVLRLALVADGIGEFPRTNPDDRLTVRTSPTPITDTTLVTPSGVHRFQDGVTDPVTSRTDGFGESVYAAHTREWQRAKAVTSVELAAASG